ncbi:MULTISPECIES: AraC family transcriptional regulator [unclassified Variovorax]|uniref:AraC family transcriptional regulator n=1 Tax=unclassified Variovorax TaxID=663243 RepID=UPI0008BCBA83|nr:MULTISPECIES: AraC family transcriptional regulator [unclassified Variovorax]SEK17106.1 transcriptional regulator, AraC family [Variovorax sp. OK202]SFE71744.1 transcriptional regulator, AraC family [Variovorax sp. OK212]
MGKATPDKLTIPDALWEGMKRVGLSRAAVLARARLPMRVVQDKAPISTQQFFALWHAMHEASDESGFGLRMATELDGAVMPPSFLAACHARDYRDALQRVARFKRLCAPEQVLLSEEGERCEVRMHWPHAGSEAVPPALADASLASILELGRRGTGFHLVPSCVELTRAAGDATAHERYFGCRVRFGASQDRMVLHKADLDRPFLSYNAELLEILVPELESRLEKQSISESLGEQIQWILRRRLTAGRPDIRSVASELAMSERSLQRRLSDEGLSFQALLSQTRHQLALEHLADTGLSLVEVAFMLGYEDQNSFFRAFRQWEERTPSEWRSDHAEAQTAATSLRPK